MDLKNHFKYLQVDSCSLNNYKNAMFSFYFKEDYVCSNVLFKPNFFIAPNISQVWHVIVHQKFLPQLLQHASRN
jgi:hypothetical protein